MTTYTLSVETGFLSFDFPPVDLRLNKLFVEVTTLSFSFPDVVLRITRQSGISALNFGLAMQSVVLTKQLRVRVGVLNLFLSTPPLSFRLIQESQLPSYFPPASSTLPGVFSDAD